MLTPVPVIKTFECTKFINIDPDPSDPTAEIIKSPERVLFLKEGVGMVEPFDYLLKTNPVEVSRRMISKVDYDTVFWVHFERHTDVQMYMILLSIIDPMEIALDVGMPSVPPGVYTARPIGLTEKIVDGKCVLAWGARGRKIRELEVSE